MLRGAQTIDRKAPKEATCAEGAPLQDGNSTVSGDGCEFIAIAEDRQTSKSLR
jgi:hypothetical protein